jgi:hypothetical protein
MSTDDLLKGSAAGLSLADTLTDLMVRMEEWSQDPDTIVYLEEMKIWSSYRGISLDNIRARAWCLAKRTGTVGDELDPQDALKRLYMLISLATNRGTTLTKWTRNLSPQTVAKINAEIKAFGIVGKVPTAKASPDVLTASRLMAAFPNMSLLAHLSKNAAPMPNVGPEWAFLSCSSLLATLPPQVEAVSMIIIMKAFLKVSDYRWQLTSKNAPRPVGWLATQASIAQAQLASRRWTKMTEFVLALPSMSKLFVPPVAGYANMSQHVFALTVDAQQRLPALVCTTISQAEIDACVNSMGL